MKKASLVAVYAYKFMRISLAQIAILILVTSLSYAEKSYGQTVLENSVDLELSNVTLIEAIDQLEEKLDIKFAYSEYFIDADNTDNQLSISARDKKLSAVLDEILKPLKLSYELFEKQIVIKKGIEILKVERKKLTDRPKDYFNLLTSSKEIGRLKLLNKEDAAFQVKGKVTAVDGEALPGATVMIKGTNIGSITDIEGNYSINIPDNIPNPILVYSSIGYVSEEIPVNGQSTIDVALSFSVSQLDEVVIVGYGEQKRESVVASISQTDGEDLLKTGSTNTVSEALQGMMPGLTVVNNDGMPGATPNQALIRGLSTWQNAAPLTIVDGVERDINMLDPNEIETISVLKDASATAIYGVRGANGVIMVTTKRGKQGKPSFNFSANFGVKKPTVRQQNADYVTTMEMYNEASMNDKLWDNLIPESEIEAWRQNIGQAGPYNDYFPQVNWWDELLDDYGFQQRYNLNARGGTKTMKYFVSLGYLNDGDIFNTDFGDKSDFKTDFNFKRYNWRSNFDFNLTKTTVFSIGFSGNSRVRNQPVFGSSNQGFFNQMREIPTNTFPLKYSDGEWGDSQVGGDNFLLALNEGGEERHESYEGFYDATLKQKLNFVTKGLSFKARLSYTSTSDYFSRIGRDKSGHPILSQLGVVRYYRKYDYAQPIENPDGSTGYALSDEVRWPEEDYQDGRPLSTTYDALRGYSRKLYYEFSTGYNRKFGKHSVSGLLLMNRQTNMYSGSGAALNFPSFREDWVGRATYGYDNRYLLEVNGAYTGSEKFAPRKRFGFFPSYSVGWVISEESFVQSFAGDFLNFLKVRYSNGKMGSDRGAPRFSYIQQYSSGGNIRLGYDNITRYGPLYHEGRAGNPDQTWETSYKQNIGIDFDIINKISGTIDLYKEEREGILMDLQTVPAWFGAKEPSGNIGATKNRGYEISLGWNDEIGSNFKYYVKANFSRFENRIVFMDDPRLREDYLKNAGKPIRWSPQASRVINAGYYGSLDDIYNHSPVSYGVAQENLVPGDLLYLDYNASGLVDNQDEVAMENQLYPRTTFGLTLGFSYRSFSFNALFYGVTDVNRHMSNLMLWDFNNGQRLAQPDVASRWTAENAQSAEKPALHLNNDHNMGRSSFQFRDASYVRLKNIEMSYKVKPKFLDGLGINKVQLYANGNNLITWLKEDTRIDPEAYGTGTYPVIKRYNLGLRVGF